eukprot:7411134-Pyramimonas_sp.AAC.1
MACLGGSRPPPFHYEVWSNYGIVQIPGQQWPSYVTCTDHGVDVRAVGSHRPGRRPGRSMYPAG